MKIEIIVLGKTKGKFWEEGVREYLKRLKHYCKISFTILKSPTKQASKDFVIKQESASILNAIPQSSYVVALDSKGNQFSSTDFAKEVNKWQVTGKKHISLIIGGPFGLSKEVLDSADKIISLSLMTFTHDMVRLILLEQLYRAYTINSSQKYHK